MSEMHELVRQDDAEGFEIEPIVGACALDQPHHLSAVSQSVASSKNNCGANAVLATPVSKCVVHGEFINMGLTFDVLGRPRILPCPLPSYFVALMFIIDSAYSSRH
jgi:hypothetical protein